MERLSFNILVQKVFLHRPTRIDRPRAPPRADRLCRITRSRMASASTHCQFVFASAELPPSASGCSASPARFGKSARRFESGALIAPTLSTIACRNARSPGNTGCPPARAGSYSPRALSRSHRWDKSSPDPDSDRRGRGQPQAPPGGRRQRPVRPQAPRADDGSVPFGLKLPLSFVQLGEPASIPHPIHSHANTVRRIRSLPGVTSNSKYHSSANNNPITTLEIIASLSAVSARKRNFGPTARPTNRPTNRTQSHASRNASPRSPRSQTTTENASTRSQTTTSASTKTSAESRCWLHYQKSELQPVPPQ